MAELRLVVLPFQSRPAEVLKRSRRRVIGEPVTVAVKAVISAMAPPIQELRPQEAWGNRTVGPGPKSVSTWPLGAAAFGCRPRKLRVPIEAPLWTGSVRREVTERLAKSSTRIQRAGRPENAEFLSLASDWTCFVSPLEDR